MAPALDENTPDISKLCAFVSDGKQSINYRAGTWHHPLLTFEAPSDFAVVDRIGGGANCDIFQFPHPIKLLSKLKYTDLSIFNLIVEPVVVIFNNLDLHKNPRQLSGDFSFILNSNIS